MREWHSVVSNGSLTTEFVVFFWIVNELHKQHCKLAWMVNAAAVCGSAGTAGCGGGGSAGSASSSRCCTPLSPYAPTDHEVQLITATSGASCTGTTLGASCTGHTLGASYTGPPQSAAAVASSSSSEPWTTTTMQSLSVVSITPAPLSPSPSPAAGDVMFQRMLSAGSTRSRTAGTSAILLTVEIINCKISYLISRLY